MINAELTAPVQGRRSADARATPRLVLDRLTIRSPHPFGTDLRLNQPACLGKSFHVTA
jgi:hypothetical protein